jgi:hypothetical protein
MNKHQTRLVLITTGPIPPDEKSPESPLICAADNKGKGGCGHPIFSKAAQATNERSKLEYEWVREQVHAKRNASDIS